MPGRSQLVVDAMSGSQRACSTDSRQARAGDEQITELDMDVVAIDGSLTRPPTVVGVAAKAVLIGPTRLEMICEVRTSRDPIGCRLTVRAATISIAATTVPRFAASCTPSDSSSWTSSADAPNLRQAPRTGSLQLATALSIVGRLIDN